MWKFLLFISGITLGACVTHYHDDAKFAAETNARVDSALQQGAESAHGALTQEQTPDSPPRRRLSVQGPDL